MRFGNGDGGGGGGGGGGEAVLATASVGRGRGGSRLEGKVGDRDITGGACGGGGGSGGDRFMARKDGNAERMIGLMVTSTRSAAKSAVHTRNSSLRGQHQAFVCACASSAPLCASVACISICVAAPADECSS